VPAFRPIAVRSLRALTAAGGVEQTCAAVRAGIVRLREHASYDTLGPEPPWGQGKRLVCAPAAGIDPAIGGAERLLALAAPVLSDLAEEAAPPRRAALLVALPGPDAAVERWDLGPSFAAALAPRARRSFERTVVSRSGHAGAFELLATAGDLLHGGEVDACVLVAVDSHLCPGRIEHLDRAYRLRSRRTVDGFFPGEAAVALLLERGGGPRPAGGVVAAVGLGEEGSTAGSERHSSGTGLSDALRAVVAPAGAPWVLCDLNGESYRAFEWGVAAARLGEQLGPARRLVHPASSLGDLGAATGGVLVALALAAFRRGYAPSPHAILWASSEGALRGAARIEAAAG
jgi:3-oxoacyl-[acyl-carrier-protein] synthase-1